MSLPSADQWLTHIGPRLDYAGFVPLPPHPDFKYALRRTRFEITKFGMCETFFVFAELPNLTPPMLGAFSRAAFQFAMNSKTVPLPCGLFEAVFCFPVAITTNLHPQMAEFIKLTEPPKHWASAEMPVALDLATGQLAYLMTTPFWGAAYFSGFRHEIQTLLGS